MITNMKIQDTKNNLDTQFAELIELKFLKKANEDLERKYEELC